MEPEEELFLRLIASFKIEDVRASITNNYDLAQITREELPEYMEAFKQSVSIYRKAHPEKEEALKDPDAAARRVVSWLKTWRPDLGYEIEAYRQYPSITNAGFVVVNARPTPYEEVESEKKEYHVGYRWVAMNLTSFSRLLL